MQVNGMTTLAKPQHTQPSTASKIWDSAKKIAKVAAGALLDFADGYLRASAVGIGATGIIFTATLVGAPIGIPLMFIGYGLYRLSEHYISPAAGSCYTSAGQDAHSPLRWIPYLMGVTVAVLPSTCGTAAAAA